MLTNLIKFLSVFIICCTSFCLNAQTKDFKINSDKLSIYHKNITAINQSGTKENKKLLSQLNSLLGAEKSVHVGNKKSSTLPAICFDSSFSKQYTGTKIYFYPKFITTSKNGDILVSGAATNVKHNPRNYFAYIIRLDKSGNIKWMKEYYNEKIQWFEFDRLYETDNNELIATGDISYTTNSMIDSTNCNVVAKLTEDGDITWNTIFNTKIKSGSNTCYGTEIMTINSIEPALNGDFIFSASAYDCITPVYSSTFLLDKNGNIKWDANNSSNSGFAQGVSAMLYNGNILSVGRVEDFSVGNYAMNLYFQILDYTTGKTLQRKVFKVDHPYPESINKGFGPFTTQMVKGDNNHFYVYGNLQSAFDADVENPDVFGVAEFDNDLNYVSGYTVATNQFSIDGQTSYHYSNIKVSSSGNAAIIWVKSITSSEKQIFSASIQNRQFIKSRMFYEHEYFYESLPVLINPDNSTLYAYSYQTTNQSVKDYLVIRKDYNSDTTQNECRGVDTSFAFINDLRYAENLKFFFDDSLFNKLYVSPNTLSVLIDSMSSENKCSSQSVCDTVKIHGELSYCGVNPEAIFTAYKNPQCGANVFWNIDTTVASNIYYPNDTTINITFKKEWNGKLYAQISGGACSLPMNDSVSINVQFSGKPLSLGVDTVLCNNDSIVLNPGNYNNYEWQDNSTDSFYTIKQAGKYYVTVKDFCNNFYSDTVNVKAATYNYFSIGNDTSVCKNDTVVLSASLGFNNYNWFPVSIVKSNGNDASATIQQNELIYINALTGEGCKVSDSINVYVLNAQPVNLGNDTSICNYDSVLLNAGNNYQQYVWNTGSTSPSIFVNKAGLYSVKAKDNNGCFSSDTLQVVSVFAQPVPDLGMDKNICEGTNIQLDAGKYISYSWQDGFNAEFYNLSAPGKYWVSVTDNNYCKGSDTINILALNATPSNFLKSSDSLCDYDQLVLIPTGNYSLYNWSTGEMQPFITVANAGIYFLTVTDFNGCVGTDTTTVVQKECMNGVYIPSAFTPNGDGKNDIFKAKAFGKIISFRFNIYNRFGELVFSTGDPSKGWDGTIQQQPQNIGTYIWQCTYQLEGSNATSKKGTVLLMH